MGDGLIQSADHNEATPFGVFSPYFLGVFLVKGW
jgi:hypothetical protein